MSPACLGENELPHCFRIIKSRVGLLFSLGLIDLEGACTCGGQRPTMGIVSLLLPCESQELNSGHQAGWQVSLPFKRCRWLQERLSYSWNGEAFFTCFQPPLHSHLRISYFKNVWGFILGGRGSSVFIPPNPAWAHLPQFLHSQNFSTVARSSPLLVLRVSFNGSLNSTQAIPLMVLLFSQLWVFQKKKKIT